MSGDTDDIVARAYRHPVLGERVVVRLAPETIAAGTDLEMDVLGFGKPENRGAVSTEPRRPLGFPGWALVHDKKNARYALDVVKELNKQARKARSKPGGAKDEIDKIASKLASTVPHFLPSFYEEVGRIFVGHGSPTYAAAFFGKAREAEAVHALDVDEQHRRDAFVEFALAGAVTTKALVQYAKELAEHHEPGEAYAHFRQLCLQRTLGGMPPWAGMAKELRRLAKAAGLDPDEEDRAFVAEIIESPALGKAAAEFWRAYDEPIVELAKSSKPARNALLNLFPTGSSQATATELDDLWLDLVERTGGIAALLADDPDVAPSGGRAAWFDKLCQHMSRSWRDSTIKPRAFALLRTLAPKLVADGASIACAGRYKRIDLDLAELALELGVAVTDEQAFFDLAAWAGSAALPDRGRDPVRIAAHPVLAKKLEQAVGTTIGTDAFDAASAGKPGFLAAKRAWLEGYLVRAEAQGLPTLAEALGVVEAKVRATLFADLPDVHARLAALDVAPLLARSLRIGILDELGWPALEQVAKDAGPKYTLHGGLPAAIVATATRLVAVGPRARLGEHDLVLQKGDELHTARYVQGQFLVIVKSGWTLRGYWSGAPADVFPIEGNAYGIPQIAPRAVVHADGAWQEGRTAIRAGSRTISLAGLASFDGTTAWTQEWKEGRGVMRELSAAGEPGRLSWPKWLGDYLEGDWKLDGMWANVLTAPPGLDRSPLGLKDGVIGLRMRFRGQHQHQPTAREVESIDGATWSGLHVIPSDLLALPGDAARRLVVSQHHWNQGTTVSILDPSGRIAGSMHRQADPRTWAASAWAYPPALMHALVPREASDSAKLRAVTDAQARAAMNTGVASLALAHPLVTAGVAGHVKLATDLQALRDKLCTERAPSTATTSAVAIADVADDKLLEALGALGDTEYGNGRAFVQIAATAEWFASTDRSDRRAAGEGGRLDWTPLVTRQGAIAFTAASRRCTPENRRDLVSLLRAFAGLPASNLRAYKIVGEPAFAGHDVHVNFELFWHRGNAYVLRKTGWTGGNYRVLEYAPNGTFAPPPGQVMNTWFETTGAPLGTPAIDALAALSGHTWSEERVLALADKTGMTPSEARYLLAGLPNLGHYGANFLPKELREELGLKASQAAMARDSMKAIAAHKRADILDRAGRTGVDADALVGALAAAWNAVIGERVPVSEELMADADREVQAPMEPSQALAMIAGADEAEELNVDAAFELKEHQRVRAGGGEEPAFDAKVLQTWCAYLPFVFAELPAGDSLRGKLVAAHERVLARLDNPALLFEAGAWYLDAEKRAGGEALVDSLAGEAGVAIVKQTYGTTNEHLRVHAFLRPARLTAKSVTPVGALMTAISAWGFTPWQALQLARGADFAAMVARVADTPVPAGGWEQNPLASVPKLVDKVAKARGVSKDAAALYLQLLTLLWPTPKNVALWNGWKPKQVAAATKELVDAELVLEAKRERAQRTVFLPGPWEALKSPHPPVETWKASMYAARGPEGQWMPPTGRFAALAPFHLMFDRAWKRIEAGDVPKYDEVKR